MRFGFIRRMKEAYPTTLLCKVMRVSRSGFYAYCLRCNKPKSLRQIELEECVKKIFEKSGSTYGSRRILAELRAKGYKIGRYRVRSLMKKLGLKVKMPRRYKITTDSKHSHPVAPNLLDRQFQVDKPNTVWTGDITYIWTSEGWLYLSVIIDLFSRQVVGWAMDKRMKVQLVKDALSMAYWRRKPLPGLLHHSDRGSQYACSDYQELLKQYQMIPSMSRKGNCWDNAPTERFFRSLKFERLDHYCFVTRDDARTEVLDYITFYNAFRRHSTINYMSPMDFERTYIKRVA